MLRIKSKVWKNAKTMFFQTLLFLLSLPFIYKASSLIEHLRSYLRPLDLFADKQGSGDEKKQPDQKKKKPEQKPGKRGGRESQEPPPPPTKPKK